MKNDNSLARSLRISRVLVYLFGAALIWLDLSGWWYSRWLLTRMLHFREAEAAAFLVCLYLCSVPGYVTLFGLDRLLRNLQAGEVFVPENVRLLRRISWCCFAAAAVCLGCGTVMLTLNVIAAAAALMGLIVRIVKNVFEQAIAMKEELDFTV